MTQVVCKVDGSQESEAAARAAFARAAANGGTIVLAGAVRTPRFEAPQPAIGERIRRFQRVESQLLGLARDAKAEGLDVLIALPGHEPPKRLLREVQPVALRPAAA
jgi:hypothetical protein